MQFKKTDIVRMNVTNGKTSMKAYREMLQSCRKRIWDLKIIADEIRSRVGLVNMPPKMILLF